MDEQTSIFWQRYLQLRAMRDAGQIPPQQFIVEVQQLRWQDTGGVWWMFDPNGGLLRYDGQRWLAAQVSPPLPSPPVPPPALPPIPRPARSLVRAIVPALALIPALALSGLWFFYTFIGLFKSEGLDGVDLLTPLIVGGLPTLLWVFKQPIDRVLLPLRPLIQSLPRPVRLGISLAVPVFLGFGLASTASNGYQMLHLSSFISVATAAVLMRY